MKALRTKLAAVVLMGFAITGMSTTTATAEVPSENVPTVRQIELGPMENLNGFCQTRGWDHSMPLDPNNAYSWVCTDGVIAVLIAMDEACVWHYPAYPGAVAAPLNESDAYTWRCYA